MGVARRNRRCQIQSSLEHPRKNQTTPPHATQTSSLPSRCCAVRRTSSARQHAHSAKAAGGTAALVGIRAAVATAARGVIPTDYFTGAATLVDIAINAAAAAVDLARAACILRDA